MMSILRWWLEMSIPTLVARQTTRRACRSTAIDVRQAFGYRVVGVADDDWPKHGLEGRMIKDRARLSQRAAGKVHRLSLRFRERLASVPIRAGHRGLALPPSRLIYLVGGSNDLGWFLGAGATAAECIREVLSSNGISIEELDAILDFGCGVGRVLRYWQDLPTTRVCGSDYNPLLVRWCRENLEFADIRRNDLVGRLDWADRSFDLVYALSVFTHLTESASFAWIDELTRVLKPGGHLLITTHGDHYRTHLSPEGREAFDRGEAVVRLPGREGSNDCATFIPSTFVRDRLARKLVVVEHRPEGALGNPRQDLWLLRRPG
jgi:SAM-dependent methyltransferase